MKTLSKFFFAPLFAILLLSCSSDDPEAKADCGPDYCLSELQGTWEATEYTLTFCGQGDVPEPSSFDVIAEGGSATLVVQANGRFTINIMVMFNGQTYPETASGTIYFEDGEFFAIQFDDDEPNDPTYFGDTLSGNTFRMIGGTPVAEWDFDGDENDEEACISLTFVKV
ncbi:hypothetical protein [uncultured Muriicola sp.]|uniref:hypothetical protein n=1 Tax=uncultured Muriicola sp. TaxID=1583102 RepID=UPI002628F7A2|nr:hypothetical protein [uncultured Muriicola sp.]